ncbi:MAG: 30S ribosomal protein S20 [Gemmatimonadetes bacterium]|nr:30S ribosomal protein S20 [Gemmatimonadota bacterium]
MPNLKSSKKRMHIGRQREARNRAVRSRIRTAVKKVGQASEVSEAQARLVEVISLLDRAGRTRLIHPSRVARMKSQLQRKVNSLGS